jgi:hypothetical protein
MRWIYRPGKHVHDTKKFQSGRIRTSLNGGTPPQETSHSNKLITCREEINIKIWNAYGAKYRTLTYGLVIHDI